MVSAPPLLDRRTLGVMLCGSGDDTQYVFFCRRPGVRCVCCMTSSLSSRIVRFPRGLVAQKTVFVHVTLYIKAMKSAHLFAAVHTNRNAAAVTERQEGSFTPSLRLSFSCFSFLEIKC